MANADRAPVLISFPPAPSIPRPSAEPDEPPIRRPVAANGSPSRTAGAESSAVLR